MLRVTNVDFFEKKKGSICCPRRQVDYMSLEENQMRKWRIRMRRQGVTVRDIRLAHALEEVFESALAAAGRDYVPLARPEGDRPT
jgi:hypothetical protein